MVPTVLYVVILIAFLAAFGRSGTPRAERLPWTRWGRGDLVGNVALGCRRIAELNELNPMTPHKRTSLHR